MRILGIESTAHTFGVGIYDSSADAMLANPKAFYKAPAGQGMIPVVVAEHHKEHGAKIIEQAMEQSASDWDSIDAISYSAGPGLGPCLAVGAKAACALAAKNKKPLIPVHHGHAHIEAARWQTKFKDPLVLYVSGGNTQIITGTRKRSLFCPPFAVLGETLDIGVGNLFDAFARELKLEFAHGSIVAQKAMQGRNYIPMPYTVKGMNFAFSGLLTFASKIIPDYDENDLCYSLMETAFAELCEATERALLLSGKNEVLVCGGVAQNTALMKKIGQMADLHGAQSGTCEGQYNADNGAMIALTGYYQFKRGKAIKPQSVWSDQKYRVEMVV